MATSAPASASIKATASPMPREPPVTRATRPERSGVRDMEGLRSGWNSRNASTAEESRRVEPWWRKGPALPAPALEGVRRQAHKIPYSLYRMIRGGGVLRHDRRVQRVVALTGEYRRHPLTPRLLHRIQDTQLVVDQHVVLGWEEALDVVQFLLFVDIDQHAVLERLPQTGALDLARLEHGVPVRQNHRRPPLAGMRDRGQRPRIEPVGKRIIHQPVRHAQHLGIMQLLDPIAFQRPEVVCVAEFLAQCLEDRPIAITG